MGIKLLVVLLCLFLSCKNKNETIKPKLPADKALEVVNNTLSKQQTDSLQLQYIIQRAIDLPTLQQYYHVKELPNRAPLVIYLNENQFFNLELQKFGRKVKLTHNINELEGTPYLKFNSISITPTNAKVNFTYKVEGINVSVLMKKESNDWVVTNSKINEN